MSIHLIATLEVTDSTGIQEYVKQVVPLIESFGGQYVLSGAVTQILEGSTGANLAAVIEFDDAAQMHNWYKSPAYAPLRELRQRSAKTELMVVEAL